VTERFLGGRRLGTTGRGIGPTYADKMNRIGIRVQDLFDEKILTQKVEGVLELKGQVLAKIYNRRAPSVESTVEELLAYAAPLRLVRRRDRALRRPGQRADRVLPDQAGRARRVGADPGVCRLPDRRHACRRDADDSDGVPPCRAGLRVPRRLDDRHLGLPHL